jgi:hemolysin III
MEGKKPFFRGHSHQAMFFMAVGASGLLIAKATGSKELISAIVYCVGLMAMLGTSALYHRIYWSPSKRALLKRLDHSAIYIMIACAATPIALLALPESLGLQMMKRMWVVATLGIIQALFFVNIPKIITATLYILTGFVVLPFIFDLIPGLGTKNMVLLLLSGSIYAIGGIGYGLKWPKLNPKYFGYHEYFHMLVNTATILHFLIIYSLLS